MSTNYTRGGLQRDHYTSDDVHEVPCPLCEAEAPEALWRERGALRIVRCRRFKLIYVSPRLKHPRGGLHGDATTYFAEARLIFEGRAAHHRDRNHLDDCALIAESKPTGRFLDVGTNMGFFLAIGALRTPPRAAAGWTRRSSSCPGRFRSPRSECRNPARARGS